MIRHTARDANHSIRVQEFEAGETVQTRRCWLPLWQAERGGKVVRAAKRLPGYQPLEIGCTRDDLLVKFSWELLPGTHEVPGHVKRLAGVEF
jgi:hypothetical protein